MSKTDESEVEMVQWPHVVAYPGGAGGLGAWVDVSTGDGPECITRYFSAAPQPAPARVPLTDAQVLDLRSRYGWAKETIRAIEAAIAATPAQGEPK